MTSRINSVDIDVGSLNDCWWLNGAPRSGLVQIAARLLENAFV